MLSFFLVTVSGLMECGVAAGEVRDSQSCIDLSHIMCQFNGFRKSTPPQNRQIIDLIGDSKQ